MIKTNLTKIRTSRKKVCEGDIFVLKILKDKYHWGRVISLNASTGGFPNSTLIHIFNVITENYDIIPSLCKNNLLVPPIITNNLAWSKGLFYTVVNREITEEDKLTQYCFEDVIFKKYVDENENVVPKRIEPCGYVGLESYRTIDDILSEKLGISLVDD